MGESIRYFTQDELRRLFRAIEHASDRHCLRNLVIFRIAYRCGLRASELGLIRRADFNAHRGELYCRRLKGSLNNTIRLDAETLRLLKRYVREQQSRLDLVDTVFVSQEQHPISRKTLADLMRKYCQAAKISDSRKWHFHTLKHTCAVHLAESGLDVKELNYWLAHKNIQNTMIYFQFTTSQYEGMYRKLERNNALV